MLTTNFFFLPFRNRMKIAIAKIWFSRSIATIPMRRSRQISTATTVRAVDEEMGERYNKKVDNRLLKGCYSICCMSGRRGGKKLRPSLNPSCESSPCKHRKMPRIYYCGYISITMTTVVAIELQDYPFYTIIVQTMIAWRLPLVDHVAVISWST